MYLVFRDELRSQIRWETQYNYYWKDHVLQMMTGCDPETLTMEYDDLEENDKDHMIGRLIKRQKYKEAFHVATGSSFFWFHAQSAIVQQRLSLAAGFFPWTRQKTG